MHYIVYRTRHMLLGILHFLAGEFLLQVLHRSPDLKKHLGLGGQGTDSIIGVIHMQILSLDA